MRSIEDFQKACLFLIRKKVDSTYIFTSRETFDDDYSFIIGECPIETYKFGEIIAVIRFQGIDFIFIDPKYIQ